MNHKKMKKGAELGFPSFVTLSHRTREPGSRVSGSGSRRAGQADAAAALHGARLVCKPAAVQSRS